MKSRLFILALAGILLAGYLIRVLPAQNNNFYFTTDQARDAVYVREILGNHKIFLKGPETTIRGIFTGPLWYYFIAIGFALFQAHPFGAIFMLTILNLAITASLAYQIAKKTNYKTALLVSAALQFHFPFFETSRYAFNPFPLVALSILLILFLTKLAEGKKRYFLYSLIPIFLALNSNLAGAAAFAIFYGAVAIFFWKKPSLPPKTLLVASTPGAIFAGTNFSNVTKAFILHISQATIPQVPILGIILFAAVTFAFLRQKKINKFVFRFVVLSLALTAVSYIFFSTNRGWRDWHTVYIAPILFISILLMLTNIKNSLSYLLLGLILLSQASFFSERYSQFLKPSPDPGILSNQLKVVDWIYENSESQGFAAYNYTDTFYDFPYQYNFHWYALPKYGYLPCEYSNFPLSHKGLYVPGYEKYSEPKRVCDRIKFLIIQSETNGEENANWIEKFRSYHNLLSQEKIGHTRVEKYIVKNDSPNDLCIWWQRCN